MGWSSVGSGVAEHEITRTITEAYIDPAHAERAESPEFRAAKKRLKEDGHHVCYVCGSTKRIQIHHYFSEWMFDEIVSFDKLKKAAEHFDIYGYGKLLQHRPITTVDDIRNLMALCIVHHIEKGTGIHELTYPTWQMQYLCKDGLDPIPETQKAVAKAMARLKNA